MPATRASRRVHPTFLAAVGAGLAATVANDRPVPGPGSARAFRRLLRDEDHEAWLIAWLPGADLALHDHGRSIGVVHVVEGVLLERSTDALDRAPLRTQRVHRQAPLTIGATRIHSLWNLGPAAALSVHVYAPPLTTMTFYDPLLLTPVRTEDVAGPG